MKKVIHFTQARIKNLSPPDTGRDEYYDDEAKRLMCRVSSTGSKTFTVVKWMNGKTYRVTIGNTEDVAVTDARKKEKTILADLNSGIDPTGQKRKRRAEQTALGSVLEMYLAERTLKPKTAVDYRYKLKLGFEDWLKIPVNKITEVMVRNQHKKITNNKGNTTANTTMRVLRLTLRYAKALKMVEEVATDILSDTRAWHKNNRKDRLIPSDRLQAWHEAVEALPNQRAKAYLLIALYMGFRSSELLTLTWENVNINKRSITLVDTKNRTTATFPIPKVLLPEIKNLKAITGGQKWVFNGASTDKPMTVPTKPIKAVIRATGVEFSSHDLRRTFATIAEAVNLPLTMIKRLMNHKTTNDVTGGYIVTEEETLREAVNKVAGYIQARVTQKDNVIQLHN